jgi:hypothetical protein
MLGFLKRASARRKRASADAECLIAQFGASAYDEARGRALAVRMGAVIDDGQPQWTIGTACGASSAG